VFSAQWLYKTLPQARFCGLDRNASFDGISTDSRSIRPRQLFAAIKGERFDGHEFIEAVIAAGCGGLLVEDWPVGCDAAWVAKLKRPLPVVIQVPSVRQALGDIARGWRKQFVLPVIAVTGSNGKTTVKEMIAAMLASQWPQASLATQGNLNNDIGVPAMVMRLASQHQAAVFELGMNHPGEIAWLADVSLPTVALVNNAQREHQEFMASVQATAQENGQVFKALPRHGVAVFPGDEEFTPVWKQLAAANDQFCFGWAQDDAQAKALGLKAWALSDSSGPLQLHIDGQRLTVDLPLIGQHNRRNALAAAACCHVAGVEPAHIAAGLGAIKPVRGRLVRSQWQGHQLIDDTYNANPDSVLAAIDVLAKQPAPRVLVLGDMGEVGHQGEVFHREVGSHAANQGIEVLLCLGTASIASVQAFLSIAPDHQGEHFSDLEALLTKLRATLKQPSTVLVKGSRFMKMERVLLALQQSEAARAA
jgi:UDP-N-acetylmuramoyl-tripeptide--D-alanyl-D-alanine ligase